MDAGLTDNIIPTDFVSGSVNISGVTYTSGTQLLDRLKTLVDVVYSPLYLNSPDTKLEDSFTTYLTTSTISDEGTLITATQEKGPFTRFLEGLSFGIS